MSFVLFAPISPPTLPIIASLVAKPPMIVSPNKTTNHRLSKNGKATNRRPLTRKHFTNDLIPPAFKLRISHVYTCTHAFVRQTLRLAWCQVQMLLCHLHHRFSCTLSRLMVQHCRRRRRRREKRYRHLHRGSSSSSSSSWRRNCCLRKRSRGCTSPAA